MERTPQAFTLIELLVVIAIISILAAILFPVFAQAKAAAQKTVDLSQVKQLATAFHLYLADSDDVYPQAAVLYPGDQWRPDLLVATPSDWEPGYANFVYDFYSSYWVNSLQPYVKSRVIFSGPAGKDRLFRWAPYKTTAKPYYNNSYSMNGLLSSYPASGVNVPSKLILFGGTRGNQKINGYATSQPHLLCPNPDQPCQFVPSSSSCDGSANGVWSSAFSVPFGFSMWTYGKGVNVASADGSAKYRRVGSNVRGSTDYRTDWMTQYDEAGRSYTEWQDSNFCHTMLFQPDFDFENFGSPIEY